MSSRFLFNSGGYPLKHFYTTEDMMDKYTIIDALKKGAWDNAAHLEMYLVTIGEPMPYNECVALFVEAGVGYVHRPIASLPEIRGDYKSDLIAKYCSEAREAGTTCRDEMVRKSLDTGECGPEFSDSELVVASRIRYEF